MALSSNTVLDKRWLLGEFVGQGACAKVYSVSNIGETAKGNKFVAKVIPVGKGNARQMKEQNRICDTLHYEYILYNELLNEFPFRPQLPPKCYGTDDELGLRYLVMERLDMDLASRATKNPPLTHHDIANFGLQILEGLQWLHKKAHLFIDVKPENFMLKGQQVRFVDFGLVERLSTDVVKGRQLVGTPEFCSISLLEGNTPTRRDDLEAMAYSLLSLSGGAFTWSTAASDSQILQMKRACNVLALAAERNLDELGLIIDECRNRPPLSAESSSTSSKSENSEKGVNIYGVIRNLLLQMRDRSGRKVCNFYF